MEQKYHIELSEHSPALGVRQAEVQQAAQPDSLVQNDINLRINGATNRLWSKISDVLKDLNEESSARGRMQDLILLKIESETAKLREQILLEEIQRMQQVEHLESMLERCKMQIDTETSLRIEAEEYLTAYVKELDRKRFSNRMRRVWNRIIGRREKGNNG